MRMNPANWTFRGPPISRALHTYNPACKLAYDDTTTFRRSLAPTRTVKPGLHIPVSPYGRRRFGSAIVSEGLSSASVSLAVFIGLPLGLWAYKCLMMYVFQRKIIYMGYVPPGARREKLKDVAVPNPVACEEFRTESEPGVFLSGLILWRKMTESPPSPRTVVLYLQGNAGNTLHRIAKFSSLLSAVPSSAVMAIAPRSYWTSTHACPTQAGITTDYNCLIRHAAARFPDARLIVYGHSLGGAIATCVLSVDSHLAVCGVVLENPFSSVPAMVSALYPQRWLPYHYMGPLVWDKWDATRCVSSPQPNTALARLKRTMLVLVSERDELVPPSMGCTIAKTAGAQLSVIRGALHENAWTKRQWKEEMAQYIRSIENMEEGRS